MSYEQRDIYGYTINQFLSFISQESYNFGKEVTSKEQAKLIKVVVDDIMAKEQLFLEQHNLARDDVFSRTVREYWGNQSIEIRSQALFIEWDNRYREVNDYYSVVEKDSKAVNNMIKSLRAYYGTKSIKFLMQDLPELQCLVKAQVWNMNPYYMKKNTMRHNIVGLEEWPAFLSCIGAMLL